MDHQQLYDYGFSTYPAQRAVARGEIVAHLSLRNGAKEKVPVIAASSFSYPVGEEERLTVELELPETLDAPVRAGTSVGWAAILMDGAEVGRVKLVCGASVPRTPTEPAKPQK